MSKKLPLILILTATLLLIAAAIVVFGFVLPQKKAEKAFRQAVQDYRAAKTAQYIRENEKYGDYQVQVAFLGDSLTDGYDLATYFPQYITSNRGIGGDTTFDLEARLQVSVYDLKPQVVVMLIGANNMDTMFENYEAILQGLKTNLPQTQVVLLSLTAMGGEHWGSKNQLAAYNNVTIRGLADKYGFHFVDLYTPLYDISTREVCAGYTVDGGHFTPKGYEVLTAHITPVLESLLHP